MATHTHVKPLKGTHNSLGLSLNLGFIVESAGLGGVVKNKVYEPPAKNIQTGFQFREIIVRCLCMFLP